jgi:hypothetical protein
MKLSMKTAAWAAAAVLAVGIAVAWLQLGNNRQTTLTFDPPYPETNASGDPILGVFEGRIPCAVEGCEKMKVGLVLYADRAAGTPTTYWLGVVAVAAGDERAISQRIWTIGSGVKAYPDAVVYELGANAPADLRRYWRLNGDILLPLDQKRSPKVGNSALGYMLSRYAAPYGPRTYVR